MSALEDYREDPLVRLLPPPDDWWPLAACRHSNLEQWFPGRGDPQAAQKALCWDECTVRERCLEYALDNEEKWGIWGGMSERERRRMRRQRPREARMAAEPVTPRGNAGEKNARATISEADAREIRRLVTAEKMKPRSLQRTYDEIGAPFGATRAIVADIWLRRTWRHLP